MLVTRESDGGGDEASPMATGEQSVYESLICNEYLEDAFPDTAPLLPADPADRAHARIVMDRFNSRCMPQFYRFLVRQARVGYFRTACTSSSAVGNTSVPLGCAASHHVAQ